MGWTKRASVLTLALALLIGACGDDDAAPEATEISTTAAPVTTAEPATTAPATTDAATTTAPATTTTAAPTTTTTEVMMMPVFPPTGVIGVVDMPYKWGDEAGAATQEELPFPLGAIETHWYKAGEVYAVVYVGLDLEQTGPLCPGNSILGTAGFAHVTNSPSPGASCEGSAATIIGPPAGTRVCGGLVSYLTEIPSGMTGTLYASIEVYTGTGTNYGASSMVEADPDAMPEIDPTILDC